MIDKPFKPGFSDHQPDFSVQETERTLSTL